MEVYSIHECPHQILGALMVRPLPSFAANGGSKTNRLMDRPFKFLEGNLNRALKNFFIKLQVWNKETIGNIFQRKKQNDLGLGGLQRALNMQITEHLLRQERQLKEERNIILLQEEHSGFRSHKMTG